MSGSADRNLIEALVVPKVRDLGDGFRVRRALPDIERRAVGPFVFFDQMGPVTLAPGQALDVRPHPHIGLATVTYLFEGEILHRDSLGTVQPIRPGDVNWMTAGRGIVHSERTPPELRGKASQLSGIQAWVALPRAEEETDPAFAHHPVAELPLIERDGLRARVIAGEFLGKRSPVQTSLELLYTDVSLEDGAMLEAPPDYAEQAAYVVEGAVEAGTRTIMTGQLAVFRKGEPIVLKGASKARLLLFGGEPLDAPRTVWWNFVSSRKERIEHAKADWKAGRFAPVPDETEFIPLPERASGTVDYP
jgi:redox-sensitive bicupin YhaK (pirin superfamily)